MQEAERRILQEGEAVFALSYEDGVTFAHPASTLNAVQIQTCSMPKNTAGTSFHQGISSTEGLNSLPASCSTISYYKYCNGKLAYFLQYEFIFFQNQCQNQSKDAVWYSPVICAALAEATNISVVYENKKNFKKLLVKTKLN